MAVETIIETVALAFTNEVVPSRRSSPNKPNTWQWELSYQVKRCISMILIEVSSGSTLKKITVFVYIEILRSFQGTFCTGTALYAGL